MSSRVSFDVPRGKANRSAHAAAGRASALGHSWRRPFLILSIFCQHDAATSEKDVKYLPPKIPTLTLPTLPTLTLPTSLVRMDSSHFGRPRTVIFNIFSIGTARFTVPKPEMSFVMCVSGFSFSCAVAYFL
jgi:hypothetical protein